MSGEDRTVPRLGLAALLALHILAHREAHERGPTTGAVGRLDESIEEGQGVFVNSDRNGLHIGDRMRQAAG